jgi:hypothetical protein
MAYSPYTCRNCTVLVYSAPSPSEPLSVLCQIVHPYFHQVRVSFTRVAHVYYRHRQLHTRIIPSMDKYTHVDKSHGLHYAQLFHPNVGFVLHRVVQLTSSIICQRAVRCSDCFTIQKQAGYSCSKASLQTMVAS